MMVMLFTVLTVMRLLVFIRMRVWGLMHLDVMAVMRSQMLMDDDPGRLSAGKRIKCNADDQEKTKPKRARLPAKA